MFFNYRVAALTLALVISLITAAILFLAGGVSSVMLISGGVFSLLSSFLILYLAFRFILLRDIRKTNALLENIKNGAEYDGETEANGKGTFLKKLRSDLQSYSRAKQKEIDDLRKMETYRKEFLADVSHELKTPLFAAQGFVHTLLDGAVKDKNVRNKFLKKAAKSLSGLDKMVQDLLTISQMEAGSIKMHFFNFNLYGLVEDVFEQFEGKAYKKDLKLCFSDTTPTDIMVYADREKIYQVLINLIANAIKYTIEKGGKIMVDISRENDNAAIQIIDDGMGIPPEDVGRIFERFYRVDKSRSKGKGGSGLGLAIVKHILEAHKQKVTVSSILGKGSTFRFCLPLAKEAAESAG